MMLRFHRTLLALVATLAALATGAAPAVAHEVRPGYLELRQTGEETYDVLWKVPAKGDDLRLGLYVRFPEDTVETGERIQSFSGGAFVERWSVRHPGGLTGQSIHVDGLRSTVTDVLVRVEQLDGTTLVDRIEPAHPSLVLAAAPSARAVAGTYLALGVEHILLGIDHLLFVLALLLLVEGWRRLAATITAFTVAHSITLAAAALGWVRVPGAPVEAIIALSIVFVAAEIIHQRRGRAGLTANAPWIVALSFGLLHGFGFAGALHEVGLPEQSIPLALLLFNVGVEIGQLAFAGVVVAGLALARRALARPPAWVAVAPAYAIGAVATFWVLERAASLGH
jgi:hydrogenase/urease accessory protein HupE